MALKTYPVAVIGGGSAATMAALRSVLNNEDTLFYPGSQLDKKRSRALWVAKVENVPAHFGYKKGIEQPNKETWEWIKNGPFAKKFHTQHGRGVAEMQKDSDGCFLLKDDQEEWYRAEYVILCTGIMDIQPHISGSIEPVFPYANLQTLDYCLRCDGHHVLGQKTGVIGHSNVTAWVTCMLYERYECPQMHIFLHGRKDEFSSEVKELLEMYNVKVHPDEIVEIRGDKKKGILASFLLANGEEVPIDFSFISLGMIVYNQLAKDLGAKVDDREFVVTSEKGETTVENLYVAGDLRAEVKKQIYTAWDTAVDSADHINGKIRRRRRKENLERFRKQKKS